MDTTLTRTRLGLLLGVLGVIVILSMWTLAPARGATPGTDMTPKELADVGVFGSAHVTDMTAPAVDGWITPLAAVNSAQAELGTKESPATTFSGHAARYVSEPQRAVYVVIFSGGQVPFDGPPGGPTWEPRVTGLVIDAITGEFLRGFMS